MKTSQEIRFTNLDLLKEEAGSAAALARLTGVPPPYLSQLINRVPNTTGTPRTIGDDTARKLERGMQKPEGWMDTDHYTKGIAFTELNALEAQLVTLFRKLPDADRDDILRHTNNVFSKRFPAASPANPFAGREPGDSGFGGLAGAGGKPYKGKQLEPFHPAAKKPAKHRKEG